MSAYKIPLLITKIIKTPSENCVKHQWLWKYLLLFKVVFLKLQPQD